MSQILKAKKIIELSLVLGIWVLTSSCRGNQQYPYVVCVIQSIQNWYPKAKRQNGETVDRGYYWIDAIPCCWSCWGHQNGQTKHGGLS